MWLQFFESIIIGCMMLYIPGFLILRSCRYPGVASVAAAPIVTLLLASLLAIIYGKTSIWTTGWNLFVPILCIGLLFSIATFVVRRKRQSAVALDGVSWSSRALTWFLARRQTIGLIVLYVALGCCITSFVFLSNLNTPDCSSATYDDLSHLATVRSFLDTGNYSPLDVNGDYDVPRSSGSYYPAAMHIFSASLASICGLTNLMAINAILFICCACIYPLSCLFFLMQVTSRRRTLIIGSPLTLAFTAFPWDFLVFGRLFSNLGAFILVPIMVGCAIVLFAQEQSRGMRGRMFALAAISSTLAIFTQPNAFFTLLVFASPYVMFRLWGMPSIRNHGSASLMERLLREAAFVGAMFAFLAACYFSPMLYNVTHFNWGGPVDIPQSIINVVLQCTAFDPIDPALGILVIGGIFAALKRPSQRWLIAAFFVFAIMYVVDAGTNSWWKNYLTGFWYTDPHRASAMLAMASYPLAVFGLTGLFDALTQRVHVFQFSCMAYVGLSIITIGVLFFPNFSLPGVTTTRVVDADTGAKEILEVEVQTPFGRLEQLISTLYSNDLPDTAVLFSGPERTFAEKVAGITGDSLVFNNPRDGSMFAYQFEGVRTFFREPYNETSKDSNVRFMQLYLDELADNPQVRKAVDNLGTEYVMLLDDGHEPYDNSWVWGGYDEKNWKGINAIDEDTPGFELVLSEGDMKLYRILSEEETIKQLQELEKNPIKVSN